MSNIFKYVNGRFIITEGYGSVRKVQKEAEEAPTVDPNSIVGLLKTNGLNKKEAEDTINSVYSWLKTNDLEVPIKNLNLGIEAYESSTSPEGTPKPAEKVADTALSEPSPVDDPPADPAVATTSGPTIPTDDTTITNISGSSSDGVSPETDVTGSFNPARPIGFGTSLDRSEEEEAASKNFSEVKIEKNTNETLQLKIGANVSTIINFKETEILTLEERDEILKKVKGMELDDVIQNANKFLSMYNSLMENGKFTEINYNKTISREILLDMFNATIEIILLYQKKVEDKYDLRKQDGSLKISKDDIAKLLKMRTHRYNYGDEPDDEVASTQESKYIKIRDPKKIIRHPIFSKY